MLQRMPARLWAQWCAFFGLEPWGCEVEYHRSAIIAHTAACCAGGKNIKIEDFMPKFGVTKRKTPQQLHEIFYAFASAHNQVEAAKRRG